MIHGSVLLQVLLGMYASAQGGCRIRAVARTKSDVDFELVGSERCHTS